MKQGQPITTSTAVNSEPPPESKITMTRPSLTSVPEEIVVNCLALLSKSYYPQLSLVCKTFYSVLLSSEILIERRNYKTQENFLHVCLQLPGRSLPSWFTLWIKPDQTLTNELYQEDTKCTGTTMLVPTPSSYSPSVPTSYIGTVGSEHYNLIQHSISPVPSPLWVSNTGSRFTWREAPRMKLSRNNPVACILDEKIYVMGGCDADESTNWAEVFDPNTQTWESLPDPGPRLRSSLIKTIYAREGKVYVSNSEKKVYSYDPKESRWGVAGIKVERMCIIADVLYVCGDKRNLWWYDPKCEGWRVVKGLEVLCRDCCASALSVANYGGKLLVLWDKKQPNKWYNTNIWCSVIALERRNGDDHVWGVVEWASVVLTVPSSYVFLRSQVNTK